ncbi:hypothetical protein [Herbaspirillum sp. CF444]|nr:hypothetical protein [Herbaspirillum sp. CF444]
MKFSKRQRQDDLLMVREEFGAVLSHRVKAARYKPDTGHLDECL